MRMTTTRLLPLVIGVLLTTSVRVLAQDGSNAADPPSLTGLKSEAAAGVDGLQKLTQEIVDSLARGQRLHRDHAQGRHGRRPFAARDLP